MGCPFYFFPYIQTFVPELLKVSNICLNFKEDIILFFVVVCYLYAAACSECFIWDVFFYLTNNLLSARNTHSVAFVANVFLWFVCVVHSYFRSDCGSSL